MLNLSASEQAIVPRGGSSRLLAHRLATFDGEQAKLAGPAFERAWTARHGSGGKPTATQAGMSTPAPAGSVTKPKAAAVPPQTPPAIAKELEAAAAEKRAAAERTQAIIAKAAAEFEAKRKADEEEARLNAAIDTTWARAYGLPHDLEAPARGTAADIWARAYAESADVPGSERAAIPARKEANSAVPAASDDVWQRAYSVPPMA